MANVLKDLGYCFEIGLKAFVSGKHFYLLLLHYSDIQKQ